MNSITPIAAAIGSVTVSRSRTVNLGNYENEQIFASVTVQVGSDQDYQSVYQSALDFVDQNIEAEVEKLKGKSINKTAKNRPEPKATKQETVKETVDETEEVQEDTSEETTDSTEQADIKDVRAALKSIKDEFGNDAYRSILKDQFGYTAVGKIEEENHNAIIEACNTYRAEQQDTPADDDIDEADDIDEDLDDDLDSEEETETSVTEDDVKAALKQYNADNGAGSHKEILKKFGAAKLSDLKESDYAKVIAETI